MVTAPDSTVPSTNPGWVCQPENPPGAYVIVCTTTSVSPLVWNLMRSVLRWTLPARVPRTAGVAVNPAPGVANAVTPKIAAAAKPIAATAIALRFVIDSPSIVGCDRPRVSLPQLSSSWYGEDKY